VWMVDERRERESVCVVKKGRHTRLRQLEVNVSLTLAFGVYIEK
jgi:hypothetical protein